MHSSIGCDISAYARGTLTNHDSSPCRCTCARRLLHQYGGTSSQPAGSEGKKMAAEAEEGLGHELTVGRHI